MARVLISTRHLVPITGNKANPISHRVYLFIYIYVRYTVLFGPACGDWGLLNTEENYIKQKYKKQQDRNRFESNEIKVEILQKLR